jgi:tetratricopeptide (TPR) repeat protein
LFALRAEVAAHLHDVTASLSLLADARAAGPTDDELINRVRYLADADAGAWLAALADMRASAKAFAAGNAHANPRFVATVTATAYAPLVATAEAHLGEFAVAHHDIDATPGDCYNCVRARGEIDALQKNWGAAAYWFSAAVKQAPSIPFAYCDWGRMLLARGDVDGAIAKFALAHQKGPHFADPSELWGEALILKNRSDLALAKFAEAARYVPNWGRLHLKWGEALHWLGRDAEARAQWAEAARLDLSQSEKQTLARGSHV